MRALGTQVISLAVRTGNGCCSVEGRVTTLPSKQSSGCIPPVDVYTSIGCIPIQRTPVITHPGHGNISKDFVYKIPNQGGWASKNWCFQIVVLGKTLELQEIKPVNPKVNQPWIFIGRTEAEAPILWILDVKSQLIEKDPDAGEDWRQEDKGVTEDKMVGWHYWLNGHEFEQTPGDRRTGKTGMLQSVKSWTWLLIANWTTATTNQWHGCCVSVSTDKP